MFPRFCVQFDCANIINLITPLYTATVSSAVNLKTLSPVAFKNEFKFYVNRGSDRRNKPDRMNFDERSVIFRISKVLVNTDDDVIRHRSFDTYMCTSVNRSGLIKGC